MAANRSAYHGLARAVIQVTVNAVTVDRARQLEIDADADAATATVQVSGPVQDIVVEGSASGLDGARLSIPVSSNLEDDVLSVAQRSQQSDLYLDPGDAQGQTNGVEWLI